MGVQSSIQAFTQAIRPTSSYWSCLLTTGKGLSERSTVFDYHAGGLRSLDWSLDLVSTGDILRVREVTLHCPNGNRAIMVIEEPGTVFQLKIASVHVLSHGASVEAHLIGKVVNKETGACICHIWDRELGLIAHATSVYDFMTWRAGVLPLGRLSLDVLGLRL